MTRKGYSLLPGQIDFIHVDAPKVDLDVCLYQGGYGSGKSFIGSFLGIELCRKYPGIKGLVGALTYPMVRDTTLESYFEHFDVLGYEDGVDYLWKDSKGKLIFPKWNNSTILFRHLEQPKKLKSLNLGFAHLEEMSELPEATFLMILSRMRQGGIPRRRVFGTTNPQPNKGWIHKYFVERQFNGDNEDDLEGQIDYRRIIAPSTQNIYLPKSYLKNMKNQYDDEYYRINVLGEDGDYTAGLVVKGWSDLNEVETEFIPELKVHITCDFNVDPMCWGIAHCYNNEYHFFDEIAEEYATTRECVDKFALRYPPENVTAIEINGDSSGNQHRTEAQQYNFTNYKIMQTRLSELGYRKVVLNVRDANPRIVDRIASFNWAVNNREGVRRVFVNPKRCKRILQNMTDLMFKAGTSEILKPTPTEIKQDINKKYLGHPFDAVSYLIERYEPVVLKIKRTKEEQPPELIFDV